MNRLADANSLYLRQHADNPVDWYPWSDEALEKARSENKPILLSIGYSACHWCHVMAHESFEDEATAAVMNEHFVNIKVDREERPDLDRIYQLAHQALTQRGGGWPLTVFLDGDSRLPFFAGTYFPPTSRHGLPAFRDLLLRIADVYRDQREDLQRQGQSMRDFLAAVSRASPADATPDLQSAAHAFELLEDQFDAQYGGFGGAPKFPQPSTLAFLLDAARVLADEGPDRAVAIVDRTLIAMARGGLFDHLGGGFCRYCVDRDWTIPHFEKMLYDNAGLLPIYARRAVENDDAFAEQVARMTVGWLDRTMTSPDGLFYSSLDADSEGEEGKFYVWTREQVRAALGDARWRVAVPAFGLDQPPNFEGEAWHLVRRTPVDRLAEELDMDPKAVRDHLEAARKRLHSQRASRVRPGRDEKILVSWNALMIRGLGAAGRWLGEDEWTVRARRAFDGLRNQAWQDGRLLAVVDSELSGYLDDYAYLLDASLELLQADWSDEILMFARDLADALLEHFEDEDAGGFFFTADDHEDLIQRPRSFMDESTPSGNGFATRALIRLGHLTAETRYLDASERALRAAAADLARAPHACGAVLAALIEWHAPRTQVIVRAAEAGDRPAPKAGVDVYSIPDDAALAERFPRKGDFTGYVCKGTKCSEPYLDRASLWRDVRGEGPLVSGRR